MDAALSAGAVCNRQVAVTFRHVSVGDAVRQMRHEHVGSLVVVVEDGAGYLPVGLLTDRDIVVGIVARDVDPGSLRVGDVISDALYTVRDQDSVLEALTTMRRHGVRRIPVTSDEGVLVGILTLDDVLRVISQELGQMVQAVEHGRDREASLRP